MDNDNKVVLSEDGRHDEVLLFLNEELNNLQNDKLNDSYNLEEEFAKTKKYKNKSIKLILVFSFVVVFLLAALITFGINHQNNQITVSMDSFSDLNLKGLIDSVSSAQNNYDNAVRNKVRLEASLESDIKAAEAQKENDIYLLDSLKLKSKSDYNKRLQAIQTSYDEAVAKAHETYDTDITAAEKEAETYQEQLQKFDASKVQAAQEQQKALDSERELRALEQKQLTDKYEKQIAELETKIGSLTKKNSSDMHKALKEVTDRYEDEIRTLDPVITDAHGIQVISSANEAVSGMTAETEASETAVTTTDFDSASFVTRNNIKDQQLAESFNQYSQLLDDYAYLEDTIKKIPYKNSVPKYLTASRNLVNQMSSTLAEGSAQMYDKNQQLKTENMDLKKEVEKQKKEVEKAEALREKELAALQETYEAPLEGLVTSLKTQGLIISAVSADNIKVYVGLKSRELITEEGAAAEIKSLKSVKGRVYKDQNNSFYFVPGVDKNGNPIEVDVESILPGAVVKITTK